MHLDDTELLKRAAQKAIDVGFEDMSRGVAPRSGRDVMSLLGLCGYRQGHREFIKACYTMGRNQFRWNCKRKDA